jgi:hypothetical protein
VILKKAQYISTVSNSQFTSFGREREAVEYACELKSEEILVLRAIFEYVFKVKRSPAIDELESALRKPSNAIVRIVDELEKKDVLVRKRGTQEIISIYPFSLEPTRHQVVLPDGTKLFAMCAVDALGAPIMLAKDAKMISRCEMCNQEVTVEIKNEKIRSISPPGAIICSTKTQTYPAAETCCPLINFFCSEKHAINWIAENARLRRDFKLESVRNRFPQIGECWKAYGEMLGFR